MMYLAALILCAIVIFAVIDSNGDGLILRWLMWAFLAGILAAAGVHAVFG